MIKKVSEAAAKRAAEVRAEARRQKKFHVELKKEDPSLWEQFQEWIRFSDEPTKPTKGSK